MRRRGRYLMSYGGNYNMFIIDFDDTLFDTYRWKQERFKPLAELGVTPEFAQVTYREIRNTLGAVYSNERHAELLGSHGYPKEAVLKALEDNSTESTLKRFVFSDSIPFLEFLKKTGQKIILLSIGDPSFQRVKLNGIGFLKYFDEIYFVDRHKEKNMAPILQLCAAHETMWFINDKVEETESVVQMCQQIQPVLKVCEEFLITDYEASGFPYFKSLTEIAEFIQSKSN